jgi:hypothetical protein
MNLDFVDLKYTSLLICKIYSKNFETSNVYFLNVCNKGSREPGSHIDALHFGVSIHTLTYI